MPEAPLTSDTGISVFGKKRRPGWWRRRREVHRGSLIATALWRAGICDEPTAKRFRAAYDRELEKADRRETARA